MIEIEGTDVGNKAEINETTPLHYRNDKGKEDDVIRRAQKGDGEAFTWLVQRYYSSILNFLYRLTAGDYGYAEDLAQETFLRCYRHLKKYKFQYAFSTWLFTVATNVCKKKWHKHKAGEVKMMQGDSKMGETKYGLSPLAKAEQGEQVRLLLLSIRALPREQAVALVLREYEQMNYQQIAEVLRTNVNTIKSWVLRAKQVLWERLSKKE